MRIDVVRQLMNITINVEQPPPEMPSEPPLQMRAVKIDPLTGEDEMGNSGDGYQGQRTIVRQRPDVPVNPNDPNTWGKVQRNAPCPCGSGRKFKHCHGALV
jgi:preprotein translocase subunit SecA